MLVEISCGVYQCGDVVWPFSILCVSNECGLEEVNHMCRRYFMRACDK